MQGKNDVSTCNHRIRVYVCVYIHAYKYFKRYRWLSLWMGPEWNQAQRQYMINDREIGIYRKLLN